MKYARTIPCESLSRCYITSQTKVKGETDLKLSVYIIYTIFLKSNQLICSGVT